MASTDTTCSAEVKQRQVAWELVMACVGSREPIIARIVYVLHRRGVGESRAALRHHVDAVFSDFLVRLHHLCMERLNDSRFRSKQIDMAYAKVVAQFVAIEYASQQRRCTHRQIDVDSIPDAQVSGDNFAITYDCLRDRVDNVRKCMPLKMRLVGRAYTWHWFRYPGKRIRLAKWHPLINRALVRAGHGCLTLDQLKRVGSEVKEVFDREVKRLMNELAISRDEDSELPVYHGDED
jgi:hypothetical protein